MDFRVLLAPFRGSHAICASVFPGSPLGTHTFGDHRQLGRTLTLCLCLVLTSCASAAFRIRTATIGSETFVLLRDVAGYYGMDLTEVSTETTVLSSKYSRLQFRIGYCEATVNGVQVHLSLPAARWRGEPAISKTDFRLFLDPVLRYRALPQGAVRTIVIDPGHGGRDEGGRGSRIREKDLMLALGEATATALHKRGYRVHMTRTQDEGVSLDRRSQLARHYRADLFISLHANCFTSPSAKGIETFIMSPPGTSSTHSGSAVSTAYSGNAFDAHSARLAFEVQRALIQRTGADDRGVRHARFAVLKQAPCPAILVETGFLTNPEEERKLATPTYQAGIVNALVEAIVRYDRALQAER